MEIKNNNNESQNNDNIELDYLDLDLDFLPDPKDFLSHEEVDEILNNLDFNEEPNFNDMLLNSGEDVDSKILDDMLLNDPPEFVKTDIDAPNHNSTITNPNPNPNSSLNPNPACYPQQYGLHNMGRPVPAIPNMPYYNYNGPVVYNGFPNNQYMNVNGHQNLFVANGYNNVPHNNFQPQYQNWQQNIPFQRYAQHVPQNGGYNPAFRPSGYASEYYPRTVFNPYQQQFQNPNTADGTQSFPNQSTLGVGQMRTNLKRSAENEPLSGNGADETQTAGAISKKRKIETSCLNPVDEGYQSYTGELNTDDLFRDIFESPNAAGDVKPDPVTNNNMERGNLTIQEDQADKIVELSSPDKNAPENTGTQSNGYESGFQSPGYAAEHISTIALNQYLQQTPNKSASDDKQSFPYCSSVGVRQMKAHIKMTDGNEPFPSASVCQTKIVGAYNNKKKVHINYQNFEEYCKMKTNDVANSKGQTGDLADKAVESEILSPAKDQTNNEDKGRDKQEKKTAPLSTADLEIKHIKAEQNLLLKMQKYERMFERARNGNVKNIKESSRFFFELSPEQSKMIKNIGSFNPGMPMWQFAVFLLEESYSKDYDNGVEWIDRKKGSFYVTNTKKLTRLWGLYHKNEDLTVPMMRKELEFFCRCKFLIKYPGRKTYQFNSQFVQWKDLLKNVQ